MRHLVPHPTYNSIIGTKWVYRNKVDEHGSTIKHKARLVVQGYNQEERKDYDEIFARMSRMENILIIIAFSSYMEYKLFHMYVKSVFLNGIFE